MNPTTQPQDDSIANQIVLRQFWPTNFFMRKWNEHEQHASRIIELLYQLKAAETTNIASGVAVKAKSAEGIFESDFDLFLNSNAGLQQLKQFIVETLQDVVCGLNGRQVRPQEITA